MPCTTSIPPRPRAAGVFFNGYGDGNRQEAAAGDTETLHSVQGALSALSQSVQAVYASLPENWAELEIRCN